MSLLPIRYRFLRHIALVGSKEQFPFGFFLARYRANIFKDYEYSNIERYLVYIDRRLDKIVHPDEPTLVQYLEQELDRLEEYVRERYIQRWKTHIREEKYVERFETFMLEKFDIHCEEYYVKFRERYAHYRERYLHYHAYYSYHLHDYYVNSIYNPLMYAQAFSDHYLAILEPYARPYINNPSVNFFLILLAFMCRMADLSPLPRENEPVNLSLSGFKLFGYPYTEELNWWQTIGFKFRRTFETYGENARYYVHL